MKDFLSKYQKVTVEEFPNTTAKNPLISVCVQTYQHVNYIKACLDGILMQRTNFPFEILLGEDESKDGTREICIEYAEKHPDKIKLFLHSRENNIKIGGVPTGRFNFLYNLHSAQGKYIALCESDDYWTDPLKLQKQVDFLEGHPEYVLCSHDIKMLNQKTQVYSDHCYKKDEYTSLDCLANTPTHPNSWVFINNFRLPLNYSDLPMGDDPLIFHLLQEGKGKHLNEYMSVYRISSAGTWSTLDHLHKVFRMSIYHLWVIKYYPHFRLNMFIIINSDLFVISLDTIKKIIKEKKRKSIRNLPFGQLRKNFTLVSFIMLLFFPVALIIKTARKIIRLVRFEKFREN